MRALVFGGPALAVVAMHLATNATLGFHTDELYYLACGRHLAFGYVDFPPLVPLLARVETELLGVTPWSLRVLPTLVGGGLVMLSGAYVRQLGGSLGLQAGAVLLAATAPYLLGANWVFQTVTFDEATGMLAVYWFVRIVTERRGRNWIFLGITLGLGLEVKYTIAGLILGMAVAVLATQDLRAVLRTRWPWIGAGLALLIWLPNLAWQIANGFPSLDYIANHRSDVSAGGGAISFLLQVGVYLFFVLPLWVAGLFSLVRDRGLRPVGIVAIAPFVIFLLVGKPEYAIASVPVALAQGLIVISRVRRQRLRRGLGIAVVVASALQLVVFAQLVLPITPPSRIHALGLDSQNELFADSVGWEDIPRQVSTIYYSLPASARSGSVIISAYYGVPGAVDVYGAPSRLPPVVSPQLSDYYWIPDNLTATNALMVDYAPQDVAWMCASPELVGHLTVPYGVRGLEQGAPVTYCRLTASMATVWPRLRQFS